MTQVDAQQLVLAPTVVEERGDKYRPIHWSICRRLLSYMWRFPRLQTIIIIYAVLLATINSAVPVVITETIRWTIESPQRWIDLTGLSQNAGIMVGAGAVALLGVLYFVVMAFRLVSIHRLSELVVFDLRHDIFSHVQRLDMRYFDRTKLGRILSRGTGDVAAVRNAVAQVIPRMLIHGLMMVYLFIIMVVYDWVLAMVLLVIAPLLYMVNNVFRRRLGHSYRIVQESFSRITANLAESVSGMRVTQAFTRESLNAKMFRDLCLEHRGNNMKAARLHGLYIPLFDVSSQVVAVIILIVGSWRISHDLMDVADLIGFLLCTGGFFISIIILAELYNTTLQAMAGGERIFALLDTEPKIADGAEARDLPRTNHGARIRFEGVTFGYDPDEPVLREISFTAEPDSTIALVGHTGSGKTSIVNLICRLYEFQSGRITIDDLDIRDIRLKSLHRQMGLVLQEPFLFMGTVADNIRFGRPEATDDEIREACRVLDCLDVMESLADGLNTDVGERGGNLSAGERQLVTFARAMLANPRILMLDEATSAVDTFTEHRIQRALEHLMQGRTNIVVAHRLSTIRRADTILVIDHGCITEQGTHEQLLDGGGQYAELYEQFVRLNDAREDES